MKRKNIADDVMELPLGCTNKRMYPAEFNAVLPWSPPLKSKVVTNHKVTPIVQLP